MRRRAKAPTIVFAAGGGGSREAGAAFGARLAISCLGLAAFLTALLAGAATAGAADGCPNAELRTGLAAGLPDCRAYEMVSPLDKGNDLLPGAPARASLDGNAFEYEAFGAFAGTESSNHSNQYIGWRSPSGWGTEALNPYSRPELLAAYFTNNAFFEFTADLTKGVLLSGHDPNDKSGDFSEDQKRLYLRTKSGPTFTPLTPTVSSPGLFSSGPRYGGSSADMSRIFLESPEPAEPLTPDAPSFATEAYEWHEGDFSLIGTLPNGEVAPGGALIGQGAGGVSDSREAVSGDGTQVVLTMGSPGQLYLREDGEPKLISGSQVPGEEGTPAPHGATFMGSRSADGKKLSTIYFASPDALTDGADADPSVTNANELYAYDVETEELSFLTVRTNPEARPSASVYTSWIAASQSGDYVYFVAAGALTPGTSVGGKKELYLWHKGELTALGPMPNPPSGSNRAALNPAGTRLLVLSDSRLAPEGPAGPLDQAYFYDALANKWTCISCSRTGATTEPAFLRFWMTGYAGLRGVSYRARTLSSDGSRAFFETAERLVPRDGNGGADVYEWRDGRANLLSSGRDPSGAHFLDASPDGRDVFIATREQLVPEDKDAFTDVYDIREGGGFLYQAPVPCSGDSCQGTPGAAREWSSPGSARLSGTGNAKERRRARCAKPRKARAKKGAKGRKHGAKKAGASAAKAKRRCAKRHRAKKRKAAARHRAGAKGRGGNR